MKSNFKYSLVSLNVILVNGIKWVIKCWSSEKEDDKVSLHWNIVISSSTPTGFESLDGR